MTEATQQGFWGTKRGTWIALGVAAVISVLLTSGNLGGVGIWEPWESNEIAVAQEYASRGAPPQSDDPKAASWNAAVPTFQKRPVDRPLLKTILISKAVGASQVDAAAIGTLERRARMPVALATLLLALGALAWLYRRFGALPAAVATVVFVTSPAVYLGAHNLASEMLFMVTTSAAIIAFAELTLDPKRRWLWGGLFGVALSLAVLDQRALGLFLPLLVLGAFAVGEVVLGEVIRRRDGPSAPRRFGVAEVAGAAVALLGVGATVLWVVGKQPAGEDTHIPTYVLQIATLVIATLWALGMFWFARKSKPGRALFSAPGLLGVGLGVATAIGLARLYSAANPILLDGGHLFGDVRVLAYMLNNHIFETSLAENHLTFDIAIRQVGFSLFPWVGLVPLGFVYISRATATRDDEGEDRGPELFEPAMVIRRLLLVWMVMTAVVMGVASAWHHYFYPAYLPIAASIGLALADREFWTRMHRHPLAPHAVGFVAIMVVLMLGKDLERFPSRFIETYLALQEGFKFPDDFSWGALYKPLKYLICLVFMVHFFGLVSWAVITWGRLKRAPQMWASVRARRWDEVWGPPSDEAPFLSRMREKDEIRSGDGLVARVARAVETPVGFAPGLALFMTVVSTFFLFSFIPNVTNHLSQRGVFETYTRLADPGEKLYRYQVSSRDNSVYLTDVDTIKGGSEFGTLFESDKRFFAVIPRAKLASVNYDVRNRFKRNIYVLDARSGRLLLVSNKLEEGETDHSFVNDKIVEGEPDIDFPVAFESGGEKKHPTFDGQLEMLGYSLDRKPGADGLVEYGWGDIMTITYYFKVLKRVPSSQKIFLHVDYPGTRINGDHVPNDGDFPTNYWMPGDIVKDVHPVTIESYSTPGVYTLNMGFYLGSRRMKVEPREAHDGRDRITIGKIRVSSGI